MLGAVLTGGASRRMGRDKALVEVDGVAMVERVGRAMEDACTEVVAVGPAHLAGRWRCLPDEFPGEGPLGGIITALGQTPEHGAVFVAACDLPWLDAATVHRLVAAATAGGDGPPPVVVARSDRIEPLCAIWPRDAALDVLTECFAAGERAVHVALQRLVFTAVDVDPDRVRNVNTPDDLPSR